MIDQNIGVIANIKLRIYKTALVLGTIIPGIIWFFEYSDQNPNRLNLFFLPLISLLCLFFTLLFLRFANKYLATFELIVYTTIFVYLSLFFVSIALEGLKTGIFDMQRSLLWMPMIYIAGFFMFSRQTALRVSFGYFTVIFIVGLMFLSVTSINDHFQQNIRLIFELFASNITYIIVLNIIVLLKDQVLDGEVKTNTISIMAYTDGLTGLFNRRRMEELIQIQIKRGADFSILMADVDNFKKVNDTFGHDRGDIVLIEIAGLLRKHLRSNDYICRWGGDEFAVLCPDLSDSDAYIIQTRIEELNQNPDIEVLNCPLSFGVSSYKKGDSLKSIIKRADNSLYFHKFSKKKYKSVIGQ